MSVPCSVPATARPTFCSIHRQLAVRAGLVVPIHRDPPGTEHYSLAPDRVDHSYAGVRPRRRCRPHGTGVDCGSNRLLPHPDQLGSTAITTLAMRIRTPDGRSGPTECSIRHPGSLLVRLGQQPGFGPRPTCVGVRLPQRASPRSCPQQHALGRRSSSSLSSGSCAEPHRRRQTTCRARCANPQRRRRTAVQSYRAAACCARPTPQPSHFRSSGNPWHGASSGASECDNPCRATPLANAPLRTSRRSKPAPSGAAQCPPSNRIVHTGACRRRDGCP